MVAKVPSSSQSSLAQAFSDVDSADDGEREPVRRSGPQVKAGTEHEAALARLLTENFRMVWRALRRLGVAEHAVDDAAQEVFLVASRKLDTIEEGQERRYLYGVALRVAANARRARAARPETALGEL